MLCCRHLFSYADVNARHLIFWGLSSWSTFGKRQGHLTPEASPNKSRKLAQARLEFSVALAVA